MINSGFTADKFESWVPLRDAYRLAHDAFGDAAAHTLLDRLAAGLIIARAEHIFAGRAKHGTETPIPTEIWDDLRGTQRPSWLPMWKTGSFEISLHRGALYEAHYKVFGVRLDPEGLSKMLPPRKYVGIFGSIAKSTRKHANAAANLQEVVRSQSNTEMEDVVTKGAPVSDAHLRQWYDLYRQIYTEAADTEQNALMSARGMFPGKNVSRERIRALRGTQKRGPKSKSKDTTAE